MTTLYNQAARERAKEQLGENWVLHPKYDPVKNAHHRPSHPPVVLNRKNVPVDVTVRHRFTVPFPFPPICKDSPGLVATRLELYPSVEVPSDYIQPDFRG